MEKKEFQKTLKQYFSKFKQYRFYTLYINNIEKVFNNGHGSLPLFYFDIEKKTVIVNNYLANKSDYAKLSDFFNVYNLDFKIVKKTLGYPEYYTRDLNNI